MDFIMEDMESFVNENFDEDWTNEEPEEAQEDNEYEPESDISSDMDEYGLQNQKMDEAPILSEDTFHHDNVASENDDTTQNSTSVRRDYSPSFTGLGKCKCGCGSFVGSGSMCEACGHPYKAHGPY